MKHTQRTLVLLKPDTVARGLIGEVITRFEKAGLKLVAIKMVTPGADHYHQHYETIGSVLSRHGQEVFDKLMDTMSSGPVVAVVLEGINAVELVRKIVGSTEPAAALPGTIRGDYAHMNYSHADANGVGILNVVHASSDHEEASLEVALWFTPEEIQDYETVHEKFVCATKDSLKKSSTR